MDDASKGAWTFVVEEATLEGLGAMAAACMDGIREAQKTLPHADLIAYLVDLHEIVLAELLARTGKRGT